MRDDYGLFEGGQTSYMAKGQSRPVEGIGPRVMGWTLFVFGFVFVFVLFVFVFLEGQKVQQEKMEKLSSPRIVVII